MPFRSAAGMAEQEFKILDAVRMCAGTGELITGKQVLRPLRFFVSETSQHEIACIYMDAPPDADLTNVNVLRIPGLGFENRGLSPLRGGVPLGGASERQGDSSCMFRFQILGVLIVYMSTAATSISDQKTRRIDW